MPFCCHPSRRQFLRWAGLATATPVVMSLADMRRAYGITNAVSTHPVLPLNLELVTLTETSAILTWFTGDPTRPDEMGRLAPSPADTLVKLARLGATPREVFHDATPTPYHYVELTGLEPGETYICVASSNGVPAVPAATFYGDGRGTSGLEALTAGPGTPLVFTTPQPPSGTHLFTLALCNDMHLGETVAGLAKTVNGVGLPPGISQVPGHAPYPEIMAAALSRETRARGADVLIVAGDVTSEAGQADTRTARHYLDQFGEFGVDYFVARGNHDRAHNSTAAAACTPSTLDATYRDCFRDVFETDGHTWFSEEKFGLRLVGIDTYDTIGNGAFAGSMSGAQMAFVQRELGRDKDRPTIVFGHHPISLDAKLTSTPPVLYGLDGPNSGKLQRLYARTPGVFLHHAGHTHRNKRSRSTVAPGVVFQEVSAVKEYPGGFHLVRVHTGGYAMNFYKFKDPQAQEWSERSRPEYLGAAPLYTFGNTVDRNSVVKHDLSGLVKA